MPGTSENTASEATTVEGLGQWLIGRIHFYDQVDPAIVTLETPLTELGLDSIYIMTLCGDIEDTYALTFDPTDLADLPNLREVARSLSERLVAP